MYTVQPGRALVLNDLHTGQRVNCVQQNKCNKGTVKQDHYFKDHNICTLQVFDDIFPVIVLIIKLIIKERYV